MKNSFNITFAALFTALISITAQISFVTPSVPLTLQVLGIALCGYTLPLKWAAAAIVTYLSVGTLGLPVFSGFKGGIQILFGPTGGFLWGFLLLCIFCSLAVKCKKAALKIIVSGIGIIFCHTMGILQYSLITGNDIWISLITTSLPFLVKDALLITGGYFLSKYILKALKFKN